jgi:hypothetical protein
VKDLRLGSSRTSTNNAVEGTLLIDRIGGVGIDRLRRRRSPEAS